MTPTEEPSTEANPRHHRLSKKNERLLVIMTIVFLIIGLIWLLYWLVFGQFEIYTDDAYVNGNLVQLMPQVSGTIVSIHTDDTHLVKEGQALIKLDDADQLVALQRARANLATTVRQVKQYYENVYQMQAVRRLRKADLEKAQLDLKRRIGLVKERAISYEELQHYKTAVEAAHAQYDDAAHKLISALALVGNTNLYNHPIVGRAKANFKNAYLNWVRTTIYAPVTGYIAKRSAQVGQQVNPGTALLAIIPLNYVWIDANYKENQLERIRIGQPVELIPDANGITYHGRVVGLSAGTGSVFALLPPQNATGNWIKIVQRLPVRIALDPKELADHPLQIGLSIRVTVYTYKLEGPSLSTQVSQKPLYSTNIYRDQLAHAEQEINAILLANASDVKEPIHETH